MAKRKLSRTDTRTSGGGKARKTSSRSSSSKKPSSSRSFSDKPFDKKKPSARFDREERSERPKRASSTRGGGSSFSKRGPSSSFDKKREGGDRDERSERPRRASSSTRGGESSFGKRRPSSSFDKKREGGDRPQRNRTGPARGFSNDAKPRRAFPEGFKRDDRSEDRPKRNFRSGDSEDRPKRNFRAGDSDKPSFGKRPERSAGPRPFDRDKPFDKDKRRPFSGDKTERPKRNFKKDGDSFDAPKRDGDEERRTPPFRDRDNRSEESKPFAKRRPFDKDSDRRKSDEDSSEAPARGFKRKEDTFDDAPESEKPAPRSAPSAGREVRNDRGKRPRKTFLESKAQAARSYEKYDERKEEPGEIRLNRYLANSGVSSRREADEFIKMGLVTVNGKTIVEMGYKVQPGDIVKYEGKMLRAEKPVYILMNKPKGYLTTTSDPEDRKTVLELIGPAVRERIYPVGRLDRNTTGLLLLTNDGALAEQLSHPSYQVTKIYKVDLDRALSKDDYEKIRQGVHLEEGRAMVDDLAIVSDDGKTVGLEIHIGWNRVVRRIFESLEYEVVKLDRTIYAGLDKKDLPRGKWRHLREEEIIRLKHLKKGI